MERFCCDCKWFRDAQMHRTYKTPRCTANGDDDCSYMRAHVCGVEEARLFEPKDEAHLLPDAKVLALHISGPDKEL